MNLRVVLVALLSHLALGFTPAFAADSGDPLEQAWYQFLVGSKTEAAAIAADLLADDPTYLEAHRLYQVAWWCMGDRYHLLAQYRSWVEAEPESESARVALAMLTWRLKKYVDDADEQIQALLDPLPAEPEARFHALEIRGYYEVDGQREERARALMEAALQSDRPRLHRRATLMRLTTEPVDRELAEEARQVVLEQPSAMEDLCYILWPDPPAGPQARKLRSRLRREAYAALEGDDAPRLLWYSFAFYMLNDGAAQ